MAKGSLASRTFSVCLLILFVMLTGTKGLLCEDRWFGDKCQYQCHCLNDAVCDKTTGECTAGCDKRWFGPQCQYLDAAYNTKSYLTDGIESTCLVGTGLSQDFPMLKDVMFTWMRIVTNRPGLFDHMNMTFLSSTGIDLVTPKSTLTRIHFSDTILDVYGEFQERLNTIRLNFDTPATRQSFCTMQVSSGRNVAIKQIASQSSTYGDGVAGRAVDGQSTQWYSEGSCTSTSGNEASPYWKLDLSYPVTVNMYTILGRHYPGFACKPQYFQLETYFNSNEVHQYKEIDINNNNYTVSSLDTSPINSVKLTVSKDFRPGSPDCYGHPAVSFCEMQIYGDCEPGKWGRECEKNCNCQDPCFVLTGKCPSQCKAGFLGPECQTECLAGQWGLNCSNRCEKCLKGDCNKGSGQCLSRCLPGYKMPYCVEICDADSYGENCNQPCPTNCLDNTCNNVDGKCTQCVAGYQGPWCEQECPTGQWGLNCSNHCENCLNGNCDKRSGQCLSRCLPGYKMPYCVEKCDAGSYGDNCNQPCPTNCLDNICNNVDGNCIQCVAGYQGPRCDQECSDGQWGFKCLNVCGNCLIGTCNKSSGECLSGCVKGYIPPHCVKECDPGFHGYSCNQTCPENCLNNTCNNVDGTCTQCEEGYQGPMCDQDCSPGFFGPRCANQCSEHCGGDGFCNNINGSCLSGCQPGYRSDSCEQICANGTYGESCSKTCNVNCVLNATQEPAICGHVNGKCLLGCLSGYSGITCEEISSDSEVNLVIIVVPIILVLIAAAALIFGVWFWRRRKVKKTEHEGTVHSPIDEANVEPQNEYADTSPYEMAREIREDEVNLYINTQEMQVRFSKTAIPVESLGEYLASHDMDFFIEQFQKVPECRATTKAAESSVNMHKNRYKNILAYDHSRVRLQENTKKKQGDYYNANFIQGIDGTKYIASQAPNKGVLADFIRMIWEQEVELVVMLTKLAEEGKAKCECYWPINDSTEVTFGEITVKLAATRVLADYTKRTLQLIKNDGQSRFVTHYHFTSWPDKGVPQTPWALVDFEQVVDYHYDTEKPLLVHCSAGVGRTGTFIALRNVLKEAKISGYIDFYQTLAKMRQDRIFMIQTVEQYRFLHDAAQVALLCQDALMTSEALNVRLGVLMTVTETGETNMEKEFKMVCALVGKENNNNSEKETTEYVNSVEIDQNFMTNIKNRFSNILAKKEHRPKLAFDHENEYINAVFVPSMTKQEQQLLTQLPLPNTVVDFWRLVSQYSVSLIVAFDSDQQNPKKPVGDYLPKHNKPLDCGKFDISEDKATLGAFWEKQKIHVQAKSEVTNPFYVQHIKCTKSKLDAKDWLLLMKELHSLAPIGDTRTLYMCMNGADQSGFACILSLLINRVEHDHFLTVPLVVGEIKSIRPEVIPNKDQYCSLYTILQRHCELAHVYTNHTPHAIRKVQNSLKLHPKPEHVYSEIDKSEEVSQHQKMPAGSKAPAKKTVSDDKPESKKRTESSKSRPVSSSEQALSKQSLEPQNGPGDSKFNVYCNDF